MHDLGYPHEHHDHDHEHEHHHHDHDHDHEHHHDHDHHHHHAEDANITPKDEMLAMLRYMVGHNASHIKETAELAEKIKAENADVYAEIQQAVEVYEKGNELLGQALAHLEA